MVSITLKNTKVLFKSASTGIPSEENFEVNTGDEPFNVQNGEILVESLFLSFDGSQRIWISNINLYYVAQIKPGQQMRGRGLGKVIRSSSELFQEGDIVSGNLFWANYGVYGDNEFTHIMEHPLRENYMSWHTFFTAYFGLTKIGEVKKDTPSKKCLVSAAGGATGSSAVQLLKAWGHDVIGIAGGEEKCKRISETLHVPCINYKNKSENFRLRNEILKYFPEGPEIYFDNVGGLILDTVLGVMKNFGTIISCGTISTYNNAGKNAGNNASNNTTAFENIGSIIIKRLKVQGFVVYDYKHEYRKALDEVQALIDEHKFNFIEDKQEGSVALCPTLMKKFYSGSNFGKFFLKVKADISNKL